MTVEADRHRQAVLDATRSPTPESTALLLESLQDEDALVREWAVEGLVQREEGSQEAIGALIGCLERDQRADLRWYAARALGKLKISDDAIKTALITALDDPDLYVRCFAAWAIGQLRITDPQAVAKLRERLTNLRISKTSLEAQSVGVTLARMHTEAREIPEPQLPLFGSRTGGQASKLPSTKQQLINELCRTAEAIVEDRTGIRLSLRRHVSTSARLVRDQAVKEQVVSRRGPNCQICNGTFRKKDGLYYYEGHHVIPLCRGGPDRDENLLVLCPNHHRQLHHAEVKFGCGTSYPPEVTINGERLFVRWNSNRLGPEPLRGY